MEYFVQFRESNIESLGEMANFLGKKYMINLRVMCPPQQNYQGLILGNLQMLTYTEMRFLQM